MSLIHDTIKMRLVREGYLPNYPYHLISDEEMCDAFLRIERYIETDSTLLVGYFADYYPCPSSNLEPVYNNLVNTILYYIHELKASKSGEYAMPDWIYSYMLGVVIYQHSKLDDIHDLLVLLGTDNLYDEFTEESALACYKESSKWITKLPRVDRYKEVNGNTIDLRPPTMFGEPHIIKSLRLAQADDMN